MAQLSEEALKSQLNSLLQAYTAASKDAGISSPLIDNLATPIMTSGEESTALTGLSDLSGLANLANLSTMTQIPTTWTGVMDMLPQTGIFSMQAMIRSTVGTFVFLWLLWYSKERAKARIWARAFHKQAKKFMKEYREEEIEYDREKRKQASNRSTQIVPPTAQVAPQPPQIPQIPTPPQINPPFHV